MNTWIVRTPRGKKVINIERDKHRVVMGRLECATTGRIIGTILRQAPEQPANESAQGGVA